MNDWVIAAIALVAGVVVGMIAARVTRSMLSKSKVPALNAAAAQLAGLVLAVAFVAGLIVALGVVSPDDVEQLRADAVGFIPSAIAALIIVIVGNVAGGFAADAVRRTMGGAGAAARIAPLVTKTAIVVGAGVIAAAQAGVDPTIVYLGVGALLFGVGGIAVLLAGFGGRQVAGEIAAGRAWQRQLQPGDRVRADGLTSGGAGGAGGVLEGIVVEVHPTAIELYVDGATVFVPNSKLLASVVERTRPAPGDAAGELDGPN